MHVHIRVNGNTKVRKVSIVSLMPGPLHRRLWSDACNGTCNPEAPCFKTCYAKKFLFRTQVMTAWAENTILATQHRRQFFDEIDRFLLRRRPLMFRLHMAGDFPDQDYLDQTIYLAKAHQDTCFLAFTKQDDLTYRQLSNYRIKHSTWPGWRLPKHTPRAWMDDGTEDRIPPDAYHCPGQCDTCNYACWLLPATTDVVFHKH